MDSLLTTNELARVFPCELRAWDRPKLFGFVQRAVWREARLRGTVPIQLLFGGREGFARLFDAGEHHLHITQIPWTKEECGLPEYSDHSAAFRIDWERAIPERMAAEIVQDENLLSLWRKLTFEEACGLIAPARRARTPGAVARREKEALEDLVAKRPFDGS